MANEEIKSLIKKYRLFQYEVAEQMGISEGYLSTMLRKPLTKETEENIKDAINKIINQQEDLKKWKNLKQLKKRLIILIQRYL